MMAHSRVEASRVEIMSGSPAEIAALIQPKRDSSQRPHFTQNRQSWRLQTVTSLESMSKIGKPPALAVSGFNPWEDLARRAWQGACIGDWHEPNISCRSGRTGPLFLQSVVLDLRQL